MWTCHTHQWSQLPLVEIALEVLAFCGLSFCGRKTSLSGRVFIVALSKSVHNCCVPHPAQASVSVAQSQAIRPPSIVSQADRLQGRGETNAVNGLLRMELMAECLGKRPAFLVQERPWSPSSSTQCCRSGVLCIRRFWHQFGGRLQYRAHQD